MTVQSKDNFFTASVCGHRLCKDCFKLLQKNNCPFCRQPYTQNEIEIRLGNNSNNNINPPQNYYRIELYNEIEDSFIPQVPFSRIRRNMIRKRRRNLTFEEIRERRKIIKKRMKRKWLIKNRRREKLCV